MKGNSTLPSVFILFVFSISNVFGQTGAVTKVNPRPIEESKTAAKTVKPVTVENIEADFSEALSIIEANHVDGKKLDYNDVFKSTIDSMLHTLDPHSNYFDAKESEQFRTDQSSRYFGIGATIGDLTDGDGKIVATFIKATFEGAPAHRAGLRYGDKIVEVNGVSMLGKPFNEVRTFLRGPRGTLAKMVVEKYGTGKRETVEIIRDAVPQPSISEAYMIRPGVGYMNLSGGFNQTTFNEFREAMQDLKSRGMTQLVLDLRNNGGGLVNQAYRIANAFLGKGQTVFTQKSRNNGIDTYPSENSNPDDSTVVLLVNRNSASASEILAGALQDHDRALIVGENTFGKGLVQNPFPLEYGSMLLLTIAKYETPAGRLIQRDYSDGSLYDYYTNGGTFREEKTPVAPKGEERKTDSGRLVYGGGGILPDVEVKAATISGDKAIVQQKLINPILLFSFELAHGKLPGFEALKIDKPIQFNYEITPKDFVITDSLLQAFKRFAFEKYKIAPTVVDKEKQFVERTIRSELVTAAYGSNASFQVFNEYDNQLLRAIELMPKAKQLASEGKKANEKKQSVNTEQ
ncbi:MAG: S41 family peptidase [Acidobacteria bacterium]|nr:S41 family peptidase [Acidobacteriota bacterium]MBK8149212.1 S41 family peptidase [Acidobacteriota bacterium]MBK8811226.1 S41 family peptidase [Acidobacteriota bacterium]